MPGEGYRAPAVIVLRILSSRLKNFTPLSPSRQPASRKLQFKPRTHNANGCSRYIRNNGANTRRLQRSFLNCFLTKRQLASSTGRVVDAQRWGSSVSYIFVVPPNCDGYRSAALPPPPFFFIIHLRRRRRERFESCPTLPLYLVQPVLRLLERRGQRF